MPTKCVLLSIFSKKRIKNDLSFQIGRYQSRATCFYMQTLSNAAVRIMSKHAPPPLRLISSDLELEVILDSHIITQSNLILPKQFWQKRARLNSNTEKNRNRHVVGQVQHSQKPTYFLPVHTWQVR